MLPLRTFKTSWLTAGPEGERQGFQKAITALQLGCFYKHGGCRALTPRICLKQENVMNFHIRFIGLEANSSSGKQSFQITHYRLDGRALQDRRGQCSPRGNSVLAKIRWSVYMIICVQVCFLLDFYIICFPVMWVLTVESLSRMKSHLVNYFPTMSWGCRPQIM